MLLDKPALSPVDGFDPIDGAATRYRWCAGGAGATGRCRAMRQRSPPSIVGEGAAIGSWAAAFATARTVTASQTRAVVRMRVMPLSGSPSAEGRPVYRRSLKSRMHLRRHTADKPL